MQSMQSTTPQEVTIIAAVCRNGAIGKGGDLLFHFSEDLRRFKSLTMGHAIIMGRKTFESMPKGALPGRRNIVISRNADYSAPDIEIASSLDEALKIASADATPFIIGGGEIYKLAIGLADKLELTLIDSDGPDGADTFFPEIDSAHWEATSRSEQVKDEKSGTAFEFVTYSKKK